MTITTKFSTTPEYPSIDTDRKVFVDINDSELKSIKTALDILNRHRELYSIDILTGDPELEDDPDGDIITFGFTYLRVFRTGGVYWGGYEKWTEDLYEAFLFQILDDHNIVTREEQP
jgi:hypothetical protein